MAESACTVSWHEPAHFERGSQITAMRHNKCPLHFLLNAEHRGEKAFLPTRRYPYGQRAPRLQVQLRRGADAQLCHDKEDGEARNH